MRTNHWKMPLLILLTGLCAIVTMATAPMTQAMVTDHPLDAMTVPEVADLTDADVALSTNYSTVDIQSYSRLYALAPLVPEPTNDGPASTVDQLTANMPTREGTTTDKTAGLVTNRLVDNADPVQDIIAPKNTNPSTQHVFHQHTRLGGATRAP